MVKVSKKEPLISVIVPVYKVEKYLDRCVESIVNQTYNNLEIILVDDESPDNCPKMCDDWVKKDKRIKVIHKKNGGLSDARNAGIDIVIGEYISFIDSDDWINKDMLTTLYNNIIKYNADISTCEMLKVKNNEISQKLLKKYTCNITTYNIDDYMKIFFKIGTQKTVYYACGKLYKKTIIDSNQYPKGLTSEDVQGTCKALLKSKKIVSIDYPYYYYFCNENGITLSKFANKDLDLLQIWDNVVEICKNSKNEYYEMAKFNRKRIDYTILMRMASQLSYNEIITSYGNIKDKLLLNLRKNKKELLRGKIPLSRKITIVLILLNYRMFVYMCKIFKKII